MHTDGTPSNQSVFEPASRRDDPDCILLPYGALAQLRTAITYGVWCINEIERVQGAYENLTDAGVAVPGDLRPSHSVYDEVGPSLEAFAESLLWLEQAKEVTRSAPRRDIPAGSDPGEALDALLQAADLVLGRQRGAAQQLRSAVEFCRTLNPALKMRALKQRATGV